MYCTCICADKHTYTCTHTHTYTHTRTCTHMHTHTHARTHTHTHTNTYTYTYTHVYMHTYICTHNILIKNYFNELYKCLEEHYNILTLELDSNILYTSNFSSGTPLPIALISVAIRHEQYIIFDKRSGQPVAYVVYEGMHTCVNLLNCNCSQHCVYRPCSCWLSWDYGTIAAFIVPMCLVLLVSCMVALVLSV